MAVRPVLEQDTKRIDQYIRNATVKLYVNGSFMGTGFFITASGYVLTAYHCVGSQSGSIEVQTPFDGLVTAQLEPDKSLRAYDLAILKAAHQPSHYLPLGKLTSEQISDPVVTVGYPASHLAPNQEVGTYKGYLSRWRDDDLVELSDAIKGKGHSGGSVYHYASGQVVGVVTDRYLEGVMVDSGLATRLDRLFEKWPELIDLNRDTAQLWQQRLQALQQKDCQHPIVFAMFPEVTGAQPNLPTAPSLEASLERVRSTLKTIFEDQWRCQFLTVQDRQYRDSRLGNLRAHLEQASVFVAEVSEAEPEVMFMLGAAQFALSQVPMVLLSRNPERLPLSLQGRAVVRYGGETTEDLAANLEAQLSKISPLQQVLTMPGREHFLPISWFQGLTTFPLLEKSTWLKIQAKYPTKEAWSSANPEAIKKLLTADNTDLYEVVYKVVREGMA